MSWKKIFGLREGEGDHGKEKKKRKKKKKRVPAWERADREARAQDRELRRTFKEVSPEEDAKEEHDRLAAQRKDRMAVVRADIAKAHSESNEEDLPGLEAKLRRLEYEDIKDQLSWGARIEFRNGDVVQVPWQKTGEEWKVGVVQESGKITLAEEGSSQMRMVDNEDLVAWRDPAGRHAYQRSVESQAILRIREEDARERAITISGDEDEGLFFEELSEEDSQPK